jgi:hypothetical protein
VAGENFTASAKVLVKSGGQCKKENLCKLLPRQLKTKISLYAKRGCEKSPMKKNAFR